MKKLVYLDVSPEGETYIETDGFKGKSCKNASKFLEEALGKSGDVKKKAEWFLLNQDNLRRERKLGVNGAKLCG